MKLGEVVSMRIPFRYMDRIDYKDHNVFLKIVNKFFDYPDIVRVCQTIKHSNGLPKVQINPGFYSALTNVILKSMKAP